MVTTEQGKQRKRSRPSTATNTPAKDASNDMSGSVKEAEETAAVDESNQQLQPVEPCSDTKPAEERHLPDSGQSTTAPAPHSGGASEKPSKTSKDRTDRKRDRRKERKSVDDVPCSAVLQPDRTSPVCNGSSADDMNVCKYVQSRCLFAL